MPLFPFTNSVDKSQVIVSSTTPTLNVTHVLSLAHSDPHHIRLYDKLEVDEAVLLTVMNVEVMRDFVLANRK